MKKQLSTLIATAAAVIPAIALMACASAGSGRSEGPTAPVDVVVKNNLLLPTDITVYAQTVDGSRSLLGSVHPHDSATFSFKPSTFSQQYRLLAIRSGRSTIRSELFSVNSTNTGRITWTMIPNIIGFQGQNPDTSTATGSSSSRASLQQGSRSLTTAELSP
jgi:hypothetical protein